MAREISVYKDVKMEFYNDINLLVEDANFLREKNLGNDVFIRGLIEFSNYCSRNCLYCGLRRDNIKLKRYRMSFEEIGEVIVNAINYGFKSFVLQSGEDLFFSSNIKSFCKFIEQIKSKYDIRITLSIGLLNEIQISDLKKAGVDRYLLKFETSNERLYKFLKPDSEYGDRVRFLEILKKYNYQVGSGIIVGLPGQDENMIISDIEKIIELELDMISISPFVVSFDTPLFIFKSCDESLFIKTLALVRINCPSAHMPATTACEVLYKEGRKKALLSGANILMLNLTPQKYYQNYTIYAERKNYLEPEMSIESMKDMLSGIGRKYNFDFGDSLLWKRCQNQ